MIELTLMGPVPSKKNAWKRGRNGVYLPPQAQADIDALVIQGNSVRHGLKLETIEGKKLHVSAMFVLMREHEDLDNVFTTLLDVLQKANIIANDKLVRSFSVSEVVDKDAVEQVYINIHAL